MTPGLQATLLPSGRAAQASGFTPRDYQARGISKAFELWDGGSPGVIFRQPTGSGKTVSGTLIIDQWISRGPDYYALVLAHERQLITQFADEIEDILGRRPGIEMGSQRVWPHSLPRITVASRQTLYEREIENEDGQKESASRLYKFDNKLNWLVCLDEAHRWAFKLKSCRHILNWFSQNPKSKRLGLTATPERGDKVSLKRILPDVASDYRLYNLDGGPSAVEDGWAVPYDQRFVTVEGVDFKNLREISGDFDKDQWDEILAEREALLGLVRPTMDLVQHRRTIIFNPTVALAKRVAATINGELGRVAAVALDGSVPDLVRKDVYSRHQRGEFQFLSVCGLCIAKGSLILTDQGEVPIQRVTTDMMVWDGVEFVSHDGVISQGRRPVIEYAGLKATEDHNVWTADGWKSLAECKQAGIAVTVSGIGGRPVRESDGYYRHDGSPGKSAALGGSVRGLREQNDAAVLPLPTRKFWVSRLRIATQQPECLAGISEPEGARFLRSTPSRHRLHYSGGFSTQGGAGGSVRRLWKAFDKTIVGAKARARWLQKLCKEFWDTGMAALPLPGSEAALHQSGMCRLQRLWWTWHSAGIRVVAGNGPLDHEQPGASERFDNRPNRQQRQLQAGQHPVCHKRKAGQQPEAAAAVEVYDILNAGPRNRFTANGLIVSNCREGYNDPGIQAVAVFRPTKSRGLAEQMKGRGCRPLRGLVDGLATAAERKAAIAASSKPNAMIVDLVGITGMADCASTAHILAEGKPDEVIERANKNAAKKSADKAAVDMVAEIHRAEQELDDERKEKARKARLEIEERERLEAERRARIRGDVRYRQHQVGHGGGGRVVAGKQGPRMLFGRHKGELISGIPTGYLKWFSKEVKCKPWLMSAVHKELEDRGSPVESKPDRRQTAGVSNESPPF